MKVIKKTRKYIHVKLTKEEYETLLRNKNSSQTEKKIYEESKSFPSFSYFEGYGTSDW